MACQPAALRGAAAVVAVASTRMALFYMLLTAKA